MLTIHFWHVIIVRSTSYAFRCHQSVAPAAAPARQPASDKTLYANAVPLELICFNVQSTTNIKIETNPSYDRRTRSAEFPAVEILEKFGEDLNLEAADGRAQSWQKSLSTVGRYRF